MYGGLRARLRKLAHLAVVAYEVERGPKEQDILVVFNGQTSAFAAALAVRNGGGDTPYS